MNNLGKPSVLPSRPLKAESQKDPQRILGLQPESFFQVRKMSVLGVWYTPQVLRWNLKIRWFPKGIRNLLFLGRHFQVPMLNFGRANFHVISIPNFFPTEDAPLKEFIDKHKFSNSQSFWDKTWRIEVVRGTTV